jgi:hypothetical protein
MAKATDHVVVDIDELVSFGTVKMSSTTFKALSDELEEQETGHQSGRVALIHSHVAASKDRQARDAAERRYLEEFGRPNPHALEFYRARDAAAALPPDSENQATEIHEDDAVH